MAGDRGSADIHNANGVLPDGAPWISAAQCGGEIGPYGGEPPRRRRQPDALLPGQRHRGRRRGDRVRRPGCRAPPRDPSPTRRARVTTGAAPPSSATRSGCNRRRAPPHVAALQARARLRRERRQATARTAGSGSGSRRPRAFDGLTPTEPTRTRDATPVAGVLDPDTNVAEPRRRRTTTPYRVPSWHTRPLSLLRYVTSGGGGCGDPLEREPERVAARRARRLRDDRGRRPRLRCRRLRRPGEDPENLVVDLEATERLRRVDCGLMTSDRPDDRAARARPHPRGDHRARGRPAAEPRRAAGRDRGAHLLLGGDARGVPAGGLLSHARAAALRRLEFDLPVFLRIVHGDRAGLPVDRLVPVPGLGHALQVGVAVRGAGAGRALRRRRLPLRRPWPLPPGSRSRSPAAGSSTSTHAVLLGRAVLDALHGPDVRAGPRIPTARPGRSCSSSRRAARGRCSTTGATRSASRAAARTASASSRRTSPRTSSSRTPGWSTPT